MTFENWWNDNREALSTISEKRLAKAAWDAATAAERQRCLKIAIDTAQIVRKNPSLIGAGVADAIAQRIGE